MSDIPTLVISNMKFVPDPGKAAVGQEVQWKNEDGDDHTASALDGSFDTGIIPPGESRTARMTKAGSIPYRCKVHPSMKAVMEVAS
jgi:plastocyanin